MIRDKERITTFVVLMVLALIVREFRIGNRIAADDPSSELGRR